MEDPLTDVLMYDPELYEDCKRNLPHTRVLVTGGTGFLGQKLVKTLLSFDVGYLRILSRDEHKQASFLNQLSRNPYYGKKLKNTRFILGDIRDRDTLMNATKNIDWIFHLAALKRIPALEYAPLEAIKTNITGTENVVYAASRNKVQKVIFTSSDKAVSPISTYGATKSVAEKVITRANAYTPGTIFCCTRYGNVLGSTGSVIPIFKEIKKEGVLEITDYNMTRFILTDTQAVEILFVAAFQTMGGEIFVRKCPSIRIPDLAKAICPECDQKHIGTRPGEKIHEVLISQEEETRTITLGDNYLIVLPYPRIKGEDEAYWEYPDKPRSGKPYRSGEYNVLSADKFKEIMKW